MIKKVGFTVIFAFTVNVLTAQNLIPNPGFEKMNTCCIYQKKCMPEGWRSYSNWNGNDLGGIQKGYPSIDNHLSVFKGKNSPKIPLFELITHDQISDSRDYLQTKLLHPLDKGRRYKLSMYVRPSMIAANYLDILFDNSLECKPSPYDPGDRYPNAKNPVFHSYLVHRRNNYSRDTPLIREPDIRFHAKNDFIYDRKNLFNKESEWIKLSMEFQAKKNAEFMYVGNFGPKDSLKWKWIVPHSSHCGYQVDEIKLVPLFDTTYSGLDSSRKRIFSNNIRHYCDWGPCYDAPKEKEDLVSFGSNNSDTVIFDTIYFKTNKANIRSSFHYALDSVYDYLSKHEKTTLKIHGYADERGSDRLNKELSMERARAVKQYLVNKGIDKTRLSSKGFGSEESKNSYRQSRRVEFIFVK